MSVKTKSTRTDSPRQLSFIDSDNPAKPMQYPKTQFDERVRRIEIDGVPFWSVLDVLEYSEGATNPTQSWRIIQKRLDEQAFDRSTEFVDRVPSNGGRKTPYANFNGFLRIAQVANFPDWESLRQEMADRMEYAVTGLIHGKELTPDILPPQTRREKVYEDSQRINRGMEPLDARNQLQKRRDSKDTYKEMTAQMYAKVSGLRIATAVNTEYLDLFHANAKQLERALHTESVRDALDPLHLDSLKFAERLLTERLKGVSVITADMLTELIHEIFAPIGHILENIRKSQRMRIGGGQ